MNTKLNHDNKGKKHERKDRNAVVIMMKIGVAVVVLH